MSKKVICLVLTLALLLASAASAALAEAALPEFPEYLSTGAGELPIVKDGYDKRLSIACVQSADFGDAEDVWFWHFVREVMNIDVDVMQITGDYNEYVSVSFASGDMADVYSGNWGAFTPAKQVYYGTQEGQLIDLLPYVNETYMPYMTAVAEEFPALIDSAVAPDGKMYGLGMISDGSTRAYMSGMRYFLNTDWLDKLGLESPTTLEGFIDMLRAFKTLGDGVVPLGGSSSAYNPGAYILNALGYITTDSWGLSPALRNGKTVIPAGDREAFGEYLTVMNQLYNEGLIEQDFFTLDRTAVDGKMSSNLYGVLGQVAYVFLPDTFSDWWSVKPLTSEYNATQQWPSALTDTANLKSVSNARYVVSSACEDVALAVRFADWFFDPASANYNLQVYGPSVQYLEKYPERGFGITEGWEIDPETLVWKYAENETATENYPTQCAKIFGLHSGTVCGTTIYLTDAFQLNSGLIGDISERRVAELNPENGDDHYRISVMAECKDYVVQQYPAVVFFSEEEAQAIADYQVLFTDYVKQETAKFITGLRPLAELDSYFGELEKMGFNEWLGYYSDYYEANVAK